MDRLQEKRSLLEELLKEDYAFVHIHSRIPGVSLPLDVMQSDTVTLKLSHNFSGKMTVGSECIEAELRFGPRTYHCKIPWQAVWGMSAIDERRFVWPDEVPQTLSAPQPEGPSPGAHTKPVATPNERPVSQATHSTAATSIPRPTLKRVK
jgi:stringent starvation protein B